MSEKQVTHTPGPWHYSEVIKGRDQYYRQIRADFKIAEVHACHSGVAGSKKGREEDQANARLIARAPEMYEVLSELLEALEISKNYGWDEEYEKVRAILDKVEGETA